MNCDDERRTLNLPDIDPVEAIGDFRGEGLASLGPD